MSQVPPVTISEAPTSASGGPSGGAPSASENHASHVTLTPSQGGSPAAAPSPSSSKVSPRSCVVCRTRKVRCDKLSPCTTCRKAGVNCVYPNLNDRPPRWARRLAAANAQVARDPDPAAAQVMERLRSLESMVKDLSGQLEQANAAASLASGSSGVNSPESSTQDPDADHQRDASGTLQKQFGRLVLQDTNRTRYVSSGFWSRMNDELDGLKMDSEGLGADSDTSEEENENEPSPGKSPPSTQELQRAPSERHGFLFGHNLSSLTTNLREFHPLPSQIPFLVDVFCENINQIIRIVHVPTVEKMIRQLRTSDISSLTPANEALMFSIYYAAITSMEEEDVLTNFGFSKTDLNLKYRIGLEQALAKADFLNVPDLVLLQAFIIFLALLRRHDSPRFVWMMTGLAIRMAQALGLQRDGEHFKNLSPYDSEMRRRVWWAVVMLDMRSSEDQGMENTIVRSSFDTKLPLNINDTDITPESTEMPPEREGIADMTFSLVSYEISEIVRQLMAQSGGMEEHSRLLDELYGKVNDRYLRYSVQLGDAAYWILIVVTRLVMAKLTLLVYMPVLFSSTSEHFSENLKTKLLVAAIEIAEYNHALNSEQSARQWRWMYQTYTHWYSVVYLLLECSRRPWSPIVERAWVALHSQWLIPPQSHMDKNISVWVPLRKLMGKARRHREAEIQRLKNDLQAAKKLQREDQDFPIPGSPGPFPAGSNAVERFRDIWRQSVGLPEGFENSQQKTEQPVSMQPSTPPFTLKKGVDPASNTTFEPTYLGDGGFQGTQNLGSSPSFESGIATNIQTNFPIKAGPELSYNSLPAIEAWPVGSFGPGFVPFLWADTDPSVDVFANVEIEAVDINMDLDGEVDWYNWVESANRME